MRYKTGSVFMFAGTVLLLAAMSLFSYNLWDERRAGRSAEEVCNLLDSVQESDGNLVAGGGHQTFKVPQDGIMPVIIIDGYEYIGTLSIPRFGLEMPVMNEWSYPGLKVAPGRYAGSVWSDDLIICGHNYERHFGNLKNLEDGDFVIFTDVWENSFCYEVAEVKTLASAAVEEMAQGAWDLTLFTCTEGGAARVTVRCHRTNWDRRDMENIDS